MLTLNVGNTIAGEASAASQVTCTILGFELVSGVETYKVLDQRQLAASPATIYTVAASTQAFVLSIHVINNDSVARSFRLFVNGTAAENAITPTVLLLPGGFAVYSDAEGWRVFTGIHQVGTGSGGSLIAVRNLTVGVTGYNPPQGVKAIYAEAVGSGAGGGGVADAATNAGAAGGGGGGAYAAVYLTDMVFYSLTVGTGGAGGAAGANNGAGGQDTVMTGAGIVLLGDGGGAGLSDTVGGASEIGGLGGPGGFIGPCVGDIKGAGGSGGHGICLAAAQALGGMGGNSRFGAGAQNRKTTGAGANAGQFGGGGAGGCNLSSTASQAGGNGANGLIRIWEFA